jgi:hypothetical protein
MGMRRSRPINLAIQAGNLRKYFPGSVTSVRRNTLLWIGELIPSPLSDVYTVRIQYSLGEPPLVEVLNPKIVDRNGRMPEHLYLDGSLCLYLPDSGEWDKSMLIVDTLVPWAAEWLLHYEVWRATGTWFGGGIHPRSKPGPDRKESPDGRSSLPTRRKPKHHF